jgi:hypothetical protein
MVRKLVDGRIVFTPDREAGRYIFQVPGTLAAFFSASFVHKRWRPQLECQSWTPPPALVAHFGVRRRFARENTATSGPQPWWTNGTPCPRANIRSISEHGERTT